MKKRMDRKRIRALFCFLVVFSALLSACTPAAPLPTDTATPVPTPTLVPTEAPGTAGLVLPYYPDQSLHPITGQSRANQMLAPLIYEGLFELDRTFTPKGVLCESSSVSEDGLVWSFRLRAGIAFSDGSPLTAADVAASLQAAMDEGSAFAARMGDIRTIRAADELTVTVTLSRPNGALPALLDIPVVKTVGETTLGTGAFVLDAAGETLRPNGGWWQSKALPADEIKLYAVKEADSLVQAFDTREISLVAADLTGINALGFSGSYEAWDYPTSVLLYLGYNTSKGACADVALRAALTCGFDRAACAKSQLSGHAVPTSLPIAPTSPCYDSALAATLDYAPQTAEERLTAAGWAYADGMRYRNGKPLSLVLIVNTDNTHKVSLADALAKDMAKLGVAVEVRKLTWEAYNTALETGDFDLYLGQVKLTADFDLTPLLGQDGALNYGGFSDPAVEELLAAYRAADDMTRPAAASNLCRAVGESVPITPLCFKSWSVLTHWGKLSGLQATQQNLFSGFEQWKIP